jgi:outer membrane protein OmpA-like peptidoglycan-associated protein
MRKFTNWRPMLRLRGFALLCAAAGFSLAAPCGFAQTMSVEQIIKSLQEPAAPAADASPAAIDGADKTRKRAFSAKENVETAQRVEPQEVSKLRPSLDMEIYFDFNSATVTPRAMPDLERLGSALVSPALRESRFLIAGHTDAKGNAQYNKVLSQRRAEAVRQFLMQRFKIDPSRLDAVGYGKERLKVVDSPNDAANRRVQIVNQGTAVAQLPPPGPRR